MHPVNPPHQTRYPDYADDEIDLFQLTADLYKEKRLIIACALAAAVVAIAIAFVIKPTYTAHAVINLPTKVDLADWNRKVSLITTEAASPTLNTSVFVSPLSPGAVFKQYERYLSSGATQRQTFEQTITNSEAEELSPLEKEAHFADFQSKLQISMGIPTRDNDQPDSRITITFTAPTQQQATTVINDTFLPLAEKQLTVELQREFDRFIELQTEFIEQKILSLETVHHNRIRRRIEELKVAQKEAKAAGVKEYLGGEVTPTLVSSTPYLLGERLLQANLNSLNDLTKNYRYHTMPSEGDESKPYIAGVSQLVRQLGNINKLQGPIELTPYTLEEPAATAIAPETKRILIIVLGTVFGLMMGGFAALIRIALRNRKERQKGLTPQN